MGAENGHFLRVLFVIPDVHQLRIIIGKFGFEVGNRVRRFYELTKVNALGEATVVDSSRILAPPWHLQM